MGSLEFIYLMRSNMLWPLPYFGGYVYGRCHILRIVIAVAIFLAVISKGELYCALVKFDVAIWLFVLSQAIMSGMT